jgi:hypothetical protein
MILQRWNLPPETEAWGELLNRLREVSCQIKARVSRVMDPEPDNDSNACNAFTSDQPHEPDSSDDGPEECGTNSPSGSAPVGN